MYYKVIIDETSKPKGSKQKEYNRFNQVVETFKTKLEAEQFIVERFTDIKKKSKIYRDSKNDEHKHIGWIYGYSNQDISHNTESWWQEDWVVITQVEEKPVLF